MLFLLIFCFIASTTVSVMQAWVQVSSIISAVRYMMRLHYNKTPYRGGGVGGSSVGRALDGHATDTGSNPGQRIFLPESTFSADSLMASVHPCVHRMH